MSSRDWQQSFFKHTLRAERGRPQRRRSPAVTAAGDGSLWVAKTLDNPRPASSVITRQATSNKRNSIIRLYTSKTIIQRNAARKLNTNRNISLKTINTSTMSYDVCSTSSQYHTEYISGDTSLLAVLQDMLEIRTSK